MKVIDKSKVKMPFGNVRMGLKFYKICNYWAPDTIETVVGPSKCILYLFQFKIHHKVSQPYNTFGGYGDFQCESICRLAMKVEKANGKTYLVAQYCSKNCGIHIGLIFYVYHF